MSRHDKPYIVIHNHPDGLTFSKRDIDRFIETGDLEVMCAIGNDGSIYMLEKTDTYNAAGFINAYLNIEKDYPNMKKALKNMLTQ